MFGAKSILSFSANRLNYKSLNKQVGRLTVIGMMTGLSSAVISTQVNAQSQPIANQSTAQGIAQSDAYNVSQTSEQKTRAEDLIVQARQKHLATHSTWLRLHYYESKEKGKSKTYHSKVDKPDFFIDSNGKNNPQAELEAFLTTLMSQQANDNNHQLGANSLACRFPARTHWLSSQLGLELNNTPCPKYDAWLKKIDPQQLSIVFAGEYPDRSVSAFGHTLLLIDSTASLNDPTAVDKAHSLNDTVGGNPDDLFVVYAAKSFAGGYPNEITIKPFTATLNEYLQQDNRDVWTYALNLSHDEIRQIMRHVWETKDLGLPYYFTLDNCASEILRYIDVVRPQGDLLDQFKLAVVPKDVIHLLNKEGLISKQRYLPADKTLAQAKLNNPQLTDLPQSSLTDNGKLAITHLTPVDNNALDAHARQRIMVGIGSQDDTGYLSLAYRGGFNGPLDLASGYPQNFHLETGSMEVRLYDDEDGNHNSNHNGNHHRVELQDLTVLRGRSFNPLNTARHGDSMLSSWGINVQATQVKDGSEESALDSHLVGSAAYEKGVSMAFGTPTAGSGALPPHLCYALGTGIAQVGKGINNGFRLGAGMNAGCRYQVNKKARLIGEVQLPYWYHGDINTNYINNNTNRSSSSNSNDTHNSYWQPILSLGAQYNFNKNQAIRLKGNCELQDRIEDAEDFQIAYVTYF